MKLKAVASHSSYNPAAFLPPPTQQRAWSIVRATTEVLPYCTVKKPKILPSLLLFPPWGGGLLFYT